MNNLPTSWIILGGAFVVALLVAAVWVLSQRKKRSLRLQQKFGPEYGRTIDELGGRAKAESELKAREKRVEHLSLTTLAPSEAARFSQAHAHDADKYPGPFVTRLRITSWQLGGSSL